ncbi:MAG: hypothetical protein Fur0037_27690 [Planctomycetota bacterium]
MVLVDDAREATRSTARFLWTAFTRFEPAADIHARSTGIARNRITFEPPIAIDSRMKPGYPPVVACDEETARRVSARWSDYFPAKGVEMGDSDLAHLG